MRLLAAFLALISTLAMASAPQTGLWWSPSESGRGYGIDVQGNLMVLTVFAYGDDGRMQWYYADGRLQNSGTRFSGTLLRLDNGQPLNGNYLAPTIVGNAGEVVIEFDSRSTGVLRFPGGRQVSIQRQNFGVGTAPQSLLGEWLYAFSIEDDYADRFTYTRISGATTNGSGVVVDAVNGGAAELQVRGSLAGKVTAYQFDANGAVLNAYLFTQHLEEGRGWWISPATGNQYGLNAYRTRSPDGLDKSAAAPAKARDVAFRGGGAKAAARAGITIEELTQRHPALGTAAREVWEQVRATR